MHQTSHMRGKIFNGLSGWHALGFSGIFGSMAGKGNFFFTQTKKGSHG